MGEVETHDSFLWKEKSYSAKSTHYTNKPNGGADLVSYQPLGARE